MEYRIHPKTGDKIGVIGIGTGPIFDTTEQEAAAALTYAYEHGVNYLDFATAGARTFPYVGAALGSVRRELFYQIHFGANYETGEYGWTTELDEIKRSVAWQLENLQTDYIDLYLLHWPVPNYMDAWETLMRFYEEKKLRAIGVSNFQIRHLEALEKAGLLKPAVNQIELHPSFQQRELKPYCEERDIRIEAWSPLGGSDHLLIDRPEILSIAKKHGKTGAQVIIRWELQLGNIVIPKSVKKNRIIENANVFDFVLDEEDMALIATMDTNQRSYWSPDRWDT